MATVGEVGATSFDAYEGIRIVIPGALVTGIIVAAERTFATTRGNPIADEAGLAILVALATGLLLYFVDLPTKSAGFNLDSLPTNYLTKKYGVAEGRPEGLTPGEVLNRYLLLLNTEIPGTIRNRSLYIGSMYRIAFEAIIAGAAATYAVMAASLVRHGTRHTPSYWSPMCWAVFGGFAIATVIAWVSAVNYERKRAYRDQTTVNRAERVRLAALAAIFVPHAAIYFGALAALAVSPWCGDARTPLRVIGVMVTGGYWLARYTVGDARLDSGTSDTFTPKPMRAFFGSLVRWARRYSTGLPEEKAPSKLRRQPVDPLAAGVLFALPPLVLWMQLLNTTTTALRQPAALVGWAAIQLALFTLITSRGHERKLHGAYKGQETWMELNPAICDAFFAPDGGPEVVARLRATTDVSGVDTRR